MLFPADLRALTLLSSIPRLAVNVNVRLPEAATHSFAFNLHYAPTTVIGTHSLTLEIP